MNKLNLRWQDNMSPDIDAHNLQSMTDGINDLIDETENIENRLSEIQSSVVVANPTGKPKKILETIAIDGTVYKVEGGESEKYEVLKLQNGNTPVLVDVPSNTTGIYVAEIREIENRKYYAGSVYIDLDTKMANVCPDEVNLAIYNKYLGQYWEDSNGYIYDLRKVSDVKFEIVYFFDGYTNISAIEFNSEWTKAEMNSGDYGTSALAIAYTKGSGDIGITSWEELDNKPFESLNADNFEVSEDGVLSVIGSGFEGEKNGIEKTQAEYDALKEAGQLERDVNYYITDGKSGGGTINADHVLMSDGTNVEETVSTLKTSLNDKVDKVSGGAQQIQVTSGDTTLKLKANSTSTYVEFDDKDNTRLGYLGVNASKKPSFYDTTEHQLALDEKVPHRVGISSNGVYDLNIANFQSALFFGTANATTSNVILFTRNNVSVATANNILGSQASQFNVSIVNGQFHIVAPKDTSGVIIY